MTAVMTDLLARLEAGDAALAEVAAGVLIGPDGTLSATGSALREALADLQALDAAAADVRAVADILRRDQKFAPPGRPSLHLVQLRRQQAAVQQAERTARQRAAASAAAFVRAAGLTQKPGQTAGEALAHWLRKLPA